MRRVERVDLGERSAIDASSASWSQIVGIRSASFTS